jgi:acyl carrier protein
MSNDATYSSADIRDIVLNLYREVLGRNEISADDDFFDNGGDSVKGVEVIHRLHDLTGVRLSISTMYIRRTADDLSEEVTAALVDG